VLIDDDDDDGDDDGIVRSDGGTGRDVLDRYFCISIGLPIGDWVGMGGMSIIVIILN
jgi:hypothetical protein